MYQKVIELLRIHGYSVVQTSLGSCYHKAIYGKKKGIFISYDKNPDGSRLSEKQVWQMESAGKDELGGEASILIILLSEDGNVVWIDSNHAFDELYEPVEMVLRANRLKKSKRKEGNGSFKIYKLTAAIAAVNVILFVISEVVGDSIYEIGACNPELVLKYHQYYRLLTSNYLHYGIDHIFNNMIVFLLLGSRLEKIIGSLRYFSLYTGAGIIGSMVSVFYYASIGEQVFSAGASGAIFGITGALAALFLFCRKRLGDFNGTGIFVMIIGSLYHGMVSSGTDNAAHMGGCIAGFILAVLLYVLWPGKRE